MTEQTPGSDARPTPPGAAQPGYAAPTPHAPAAPGPYPAYPPYAYYPYAYWYARAYTQQPTPVERPARKGGQTIFFAVVTAMGVLLAISALALAAAAPALVERVPTAGGLGLTSLYNSSLSNDSTNWDVGHNCSFEDGGLHADGTLDADNGAVCAFQPSASQNLAGSGFLLTVQVAPAMNVASEQIACVLLVSKSSTTNYALLFDQSGGYTAKSRTSNSCGAGATISGSSVAWHADGYEPNTISVWFSATDQSLTVYSNGQRLYSAFPDDTGPFTIALGAPAGAEALYTGFSVDGTLTSS